MSAAEQYRPRYTVEDLRSWEGDWELWAGVPVSMSPSPFGRHQSVLTRLSRMIGNELDRAGCKAEVIVELDWVIASDTVVRPDVVVLCDPVPERHLESAPVMIAEVLSDSTRERDRIHKLRLHEEQGVKTYWIVDPEGRTIHAYTLGPDGLYQGRMETNVVQASVCDEGVITVRLEELFR